VKKTSEEANILDENKVPDYMRSMTIATLKGRRDLKYNIATARAHRFILDYRLEEQRVWENERIRYARELYNKAVRESGTQRSHVDCESAPGEMKLEPGATIKPCNNGEDIAPASRIVSFGESPSTNQEGDKELDQLAEYFARPVSLYESDWEADNTTDQEVVIRPWAEWIANATIRAKLSNYAFFRATLNLKITISASPYQYGQVQVSYQPYDLANDVMTSTLDWLTGTNPSHANGRILMLQYLSQSPSTAVMDIKTGIPLEIKIPFIMNKEYARLFTEVDSVITNLTDLPDFTQMGGLYVTTLTRPNTTQDATNSFVGVNISGYMTDVELCANTSTNVNITAEADNDTRALHVLPSVPGKVYAIAEAHESDGKGPISTVASAVENIANSVATAPIIGPFATATGKVAAAVGAVASLFGFSAPPLLDKPIYAATLDRSNYSQLSSVFTGRKICCDPKQELSISVDLGGTGGEDPMAISTIAKRESYVASHTWIDTDIPLDTQICAIAVTPMCLHSVVTAVGPPVKTIHMPSATYFAASPFKFWRGCMTYRLVVVCSKFHRGKLIITYEPNIMQYTLLTAADTKLNQQNHIIMDLEETQEIEFKVGWSTDRNFKQVAIPGTVFVTDVNKASTMATIDHELVNGFVSVRPYTSLVAPNQNNGNEEVKILIYARCDDLEVAVPSSQGIVQGREYVETESSHIVSESADMKHCAEAVSLELNKPFPSKEIYKINFGERVVSFRSLLKRYNTNAMYDINPTSVKEGHTLSITRSLYPTLYTVPSAVGTATSLIDASAEGDLFNYLRFAFMGMRGGYRYRATPWVDLVATDLRQSIVKLENNLTYYYQPSLSYATIANSEALFKKTIDGAVNCFTSSDGAINFEIPYYSRNNYELSFDADQGRNYPSTFYAQEHSAYTIVSTMSPRFISGGNNYISLEISSASAEDFTFLRFNGAPFFTTSV